MRPIRLADRAVRRWRWTNVRAGWVRGEVPAAGVPAGRGDRADRAEAHADATPGAAAPVAQRPLFDPARHMRVSEVKVGMKGYGLSVFRGTKIERFDVEVLSILQNFNPKYDVVLITCTGANLEHTGAIAGMSGSPIYLRDEAGRERMIGAFAYGWPLAKDPIAGVQPIEYMLKLPTTDPHPAIAGGGRRRGPAAERAAAARASSGRRRSRRARAGRCDDATAQWEKLIHPAAGRAARPAARAGGAGRGAGRLPARSDVPELRPLATPLMAGGLSPRRLERSAPRFRPRGWCRSRRAAGRAARRTARAMTAAGPAAPLEPGSVLAVPLLTGDVEMTALGTCTEVLGDRVYGFGHAFNNEGPVTLPMGSGQVNGVVATLSTSFKLGSLTRERGRLTADETVGVAGRLGESAPTVPVELKVFDAGPGEGPATSSRGSTTFGRPCTRSSRR